MEYDLAERTTTFSKNILIFLKDLVANDLNKNIISQVIRSSTSVGANYCEANGASSKKILEIKYTSVKKKYKKRSIG